MDLFHPSYRVKCVNKMPLSVLKYQNDIYLDIIECEKAGLISVHVNVDPEKLKGLQQEFIPLYILNGIGGEEDLWNKMRIEIIEILVEKLLLKELINELRDELKEDAEAFVIAKCKEQYRKLLNMGPFSTKSPYNDHEEYKGSSRSN